MNTYKILITTLVTVGLILAGCEDNAGKVKEEITSQYIMSFWRAFQKADFNQMEGFYSNKVILLPRSMLRYKALGINNSGDRSKAKTYHRKDVFKAYGNMRNILGEEKWKYLFSGIDDKNIEIGRVEKRRVNRYRSGHDDIALVVRTGDSNDRLIFVFSKDTHKIIAQTIIIVFPGSHYFDHYKPG